MAVVTTYTLRSVVPEDGPSYTVPDVPGAVMVNKETEEIYTAYFTPTNRKWYVMYKLDATSFAVEAVGIRPPTGTRFGTWAAANRDKIEYWRVEGERDDVDEDDKPITRTVNEVRRVRSVPAKDASDSERWTVGDVKEITRATPAIRSECGALKESTL